ncbi:MAG TPA: hypothetical protein VIS05_06620 [Ilumatobacter sp.]
MPSTTTTMFVEIPCYWYNHIADDALADRYNQVTAEIIEVLDPFVTGGLRITITYYSDRGWLHRWSDVAGEFQRHQYADCTGATAPNGVSTGDTRWVTVAAPSPLILLPAATDRATRPITLPVPLVSPPDRSAVNLGLWLAVEPAGPISVRASLGPLWAETTATMAFTSFDPGTGDRAVVCAGNGTPIPADRLGTVDEGPCGYTYTSDTDGVPLAMTITSTWSVTWRLSDGSSGTAPDIAVTTVMPYAVYEIQTVGVDG